MGVHRFVLGNGPRLFGARVGGTELALHRYQGIGSAWADTVSRDGYRRRWTIFLLGGPTASVLAAVTLFAFAGRTGLGAAMFAVGVLNVLMAAVILRPGRGFGGTVSSDIADLRSRWAMTPAEIEDDIAFAASERIAAFGEARTTDAVDVARFFLSQYPDSKHARGSTRRWTTSAPELSTTHPPTGG